MGLLARALARDEARADAAWLADTDMDGGRPTAAGVRVTRHAALGLTTVFRCVDLLCSAISQAPKDIVIKLGGRSFPEFEKPDWLKMPDPTRPTYTVSDYFMQVAFSLLLDGNYFVWVAPDIYAPQVLTVLEPGRVTPLESGRFEVRNKNGQLDRVLEPHEMLHGTWMLPPGAVRGISPLEVLRRQIGSAIAAEDHAARFFGQGASLSFGVEVPGALDKAQKDELSGSLKRRYAGNRNSHAIGVLTAGAKFVPGLAPTPEQAQMLATRQFSVEDLCRPFGVPPHMVGSQQPGAVSYASVNGTLLEFKQYAALPLALRIEAQHNRLVTVPDSLAATTATAQFRFNLDGIARADLLTRYQAHKEGIQGGFLTPDEARTDEDLPPKGGVANELFMQMQMVPLTRNPVAEGGSTP